MLSVDGVGAFDLISWSAMLQGLKDAPGCERALPFVLQFYGRPSTYLWEDDCAVVHEITQGEGGEQGDPLMPALYALGVKSQLRCKLQEHSLLLQRIEAVPDLQCAWLILMFCAAARANYFLRVVHPGSSEEFARQHDAAIC